MISRTYVLCLTCAKPITARIQVGHEIEQPMTFPCPHCGTDIGLTLILDEPPRVKIRWDNNCKEGSEEGKIINLGVGFTISKDRLHQDMYFPSFDQPKPRISITRSPGQVGPEFRDIFVDLGGLPRASDYWKIIQKALRFHRTGQNSLRDAQLDSFWGTARTDDHNLDEAVFQFFTRMLAPRTQALLDQVAEELKNAHSQNSVEFFRLAEDYDRDLKTDRFQGYSDILAEYFRGYTEFNQTLVYLRSDLPLPPDAVATSSAFETSKMFYGNAFELLGSHLDVPAAINNIVAGRPYDQMKAMDLKQFRSINKANRTNCLSGNAAMSSFVAEYDSAVRNASHHRWFKLDDSREHILYRSGGTGALHKMSYAEYLYRCNKLVFQIMLLACFELLLLQFSRKSL